MANLKNNISFHPKAITYHNEIWQTFIKTKEFMVKHNFSLNDVKLRYAENENILDDINHFDIISIYTTITLATQLKEQYQAFIDFSQMAKNPSIMHLHEQLQDNKRNDLFATMTYLRNLIGHCGFMFSTDGKQLRIKKEQKVFSKEDVKSYVDASIKIIEESLLKREDKTYKIANISAAKKYIRNEAAFNPHGNMNIDNIFNQLINIYEINKENSNKTNENNQLNEINLLSLLEDEQASNRLDKPNLMNDKVFLFVVYSKMNDLILANPDKKFEEIQDMMVQYIEKYNDSPIYLKLLNLIKNPENILDLDAIVYSMFVFTAGFDRTADHLETLSLTTIDGTQQINYESLRGAIIHGRYFKRGGKFILKDFTSQGEEKHKKYQKEQQKPFKTMRIKEKQPAIQKMVYTEADFKEQYSLTREDLYYLCDILSEKVYEDEYCS